MIKRYVVHVVGPLFILLLIVLSLPITAPPVRAATLPVASAPAQYFIVSSWLGTISVPVRLRWSGRADGGVASYRLQQSTNGRAYQTITLPSPTSTTLTRQLNPDSNYRFRVQVRDRAGNLSAWAYGPVFTVASQQENNGAVAYGGTWTREATSGAYRGYARYASASGATATFRFTGRNVAWIAPKGTKGGKAEVYVDGTYAATVNLYSTTELPRRVVFARSWGSTASHTLRVRVVGVYGRHVGVDAFVALHTDPVLVGAGDIADCATLGDEATARLLDRTAGTVYTVGDHAYFDGTAEEFANCYDPYWGRHKARTRPTPGNHDYHTAGAAGYFGYFGANAGYRSKGYYAYSRGTWRIYALNSNCLQIGGCGAGSPQEQWLRADLAANPRRCVLAYLHHPRFSSRYNYPSVQPLLQALYEYGADVALAGHEHHYERLKPLTPSGVVDYTRGIRQFVVGTGGRDFFPLRTIHPASETRNNHTFGVLKLTLHPRSYTWQFVPVAGKTYTDSGVSNCH